MNIGNVIGVDILTPFSVVDVIGTKHLAYAKVVIDVQRDSFQYIHAQTALQSESDRFRVERIITYLSRFTASHCLVNQGLLRKSEIERGTHLSSHCKQVFDNVILIAKQNRHLDVHGIQGEIKVATARNGDIADNSILSNISIQRKNVGGLEPKHFGLHIESANFNTAKQTNSEMMSKPPPAKAALPIMSRAAISKNVFFIVIGF